ncbi:MAG: hypothetical protein LBT09_12730 [Planctomycetaceae bacterium]|jgi:hypothetical protein|nr:hypothetical protein [Planctomycetaceae bacterium]
MEILIITLGELLTAILIPISTLMLGSVLLIFQLISLIAEAIWGMVIMFFLSLISKKHADDWKARRKKLLVSPAENSEPKETEIAESVVSDSPTAIPQTNKIAKKKKTVWRKIVVWGVAVCSVLIMLFLAGITIANIFFFESLVRFSLRQAESRTNIAIKFDKAKGSFWTGNIQLNGVTVSRQNHKISNLEFKGETVEIDLSMSHLLGWSFVFESVKIAGFKGTWEQVGKRTNLKPRKNFRIDRLSMNDIQLNFTDRTLAKEPFQTVIKLDTIESMPLRSNLAVFDVLFRSRGRGSINDIPFVVDSEKGKHFYRMNDLPIEFFAKFAGGMLDWFDKGKIDLLIEDKLSNGEVSIHWNVTLHDFHVKVPEGTNIKVKAATLPLVLFLNHESKRLPLDFDLRITEDEFHFKSSTELNDLARNILGDKIANALKEIKERLTKKGNKE